MALNLSGTSGIVGAGIGTIGPSGANVTGVVTCTSVVSSGAVSGTTGSFTGNLTISNVEPTLNLTDSNNNSDFAVRNNDGTFGIRDTTNGVERFTISSDGTVATGGNINISGVTTAKSFVPTEGQLSNRNLIINGAMRVAQRATSSTTSGTYTADRFIHLFSGTNESPTTEVRALTSSDTGPWAKGFRKSLKVTNGNQTGGADVSDYIRLDYRLEGQDISQSGWDYTSSSSYVTLSFWAKSSVAQTFYVRLKAQDGTAQGYAFAITFTATNTWTKFTHSIPGASAVQFDDDNGEGLRICWTLFRGTSNTGTFTLNQWAAYNGSIRMPDNTSTWYTTNDATFELTGVQLEAGSVATPFEHRTYADELRKCQRYYQVIGGGNYGNYGFASGYTYNNGNNIAAGVYLSVPLRASPTVSVTGNLGGTTQGAAGLVNSPSVPGYDLNSNWLAIGWGITSDLGANNYGASVNNTNNESFTMSAEL